MANSKGSVPKHSGLGIIGHFVQMYGIIIYQHLPYHKFKPFKPTCRSNFHIGGRIGNWVNHDDDDQIMN